MIKISAVTHWGIPVDDLEESYRFYTEVLGLTAVGRMSNGTMACVEACGQQIVLFERKEPAPPRTPEQDGLLHPVAFDLTPEDWVSAARVLHELKIPLGLPIQYRAGTNFAGREIYFLDPSGNMIELRDPTWTPDQPRLSFEEIVGVAAPADA